jgi:hypothetical protein
MSRGTVYREAPGIWWHAPSPAESLAGFAWRRRVAREDMSQDRAPPRHRQDRVRSFRRSRWLCACVCRGGLKVGVGEKEKKKPCPGYGAAGGAETETKMSAPIELGHRNKRHGAPRGTGGLVACPLAGGACSWRAVAMGGERRTYIV